MKQFLCIAVLLLMPLLANAQSIRSLGNPLVDAADQGIETLVAAQIRNGNNVNAKGDFGATALIRASYRNYTNIMEMLINLGADVNMADEGGATALHLAARQGNLEAVKLLLKYDAVADMADAEGWTPLMRATAGEKQDVAAVLIQGGANPTIKNEWDESAMILAEKSPEILKMMQQSSIKEKPVLTAMEATQRNISVPVEQVLPSDLPPSGTGALASVSTPAAPIIPPVSVLLPLLSVRLATALPPLYAGARPRMLEAAPPLFPVLPSLPPVYHAINYAAARPANILVALPISAQLVSAISHPHLAA